MLFSTDGETTKFDDREKHAFTVFNFKIKII